MSTSPQFARPVEILLVEDNKADAKFAQVALEKIEVEHHVHHVLDGDEAMRFLHREGEYSDAPRPDLILLDLKMPKKDGCQVLREIRSDENLNSLVVVILTTSDANEDVANAYRLNCNVYIKKHIDLEIFIDSIKVIDRLFFQLALLPPEE